MDAYRDGLFSRVIFYVHAFLVFFKLVLMFFVQEFKQIMVYFALKLPILFCFRVFSIHFMGVLSFHV